MELEDLIEDYLKENSLKQLAQDLSDLKLDLPVLPKNPVALASALKHELDSQARWVYTKEKLEERDEEDLRESGLWGLLSETYPSSLQ